MNTNTGDTFEPTAAQAEQLRNLRESIAPKPDPFKVPMAEGAKPLGELTAAKIGFRELSDKESNLVRECRELGERCRLLCEHLTTGGADPRNVAMAKTHFEDALMRAVRAVTKPAFF